MSKLYDLLYTMIGKLNSSVKTTAQTLTDAEKTQARANIGAQPAGDYAKKSEIPTVPTKVSAFTNDAGYLTEHQDLSEYAKKTEIPSKLPNPYALTINGKTYDGSSAVSVKVEGGSGGAQADWKAARGQPGHVLNRTHWVDKSGTVLLDDDAVGFADGSALIDDVQLVAGASYIITYNGETEECVAADDGLGSIMLRPNNLPVDFNYEAPNDEMGVSEAFRIYPHDFEESEAAIKIVLNSEIIHPLDKKFLPEDIGFSDWNAADGEPGHVKHRTHWIDVDIVEILPETQAKIQSSQYDEALSFVPLLEVKQGDIITVAINGMEYKCAAQAFQNNMYVFGDGNYFGFGNSGAGEPFCVLYMAGSNSGVYVKQDCTISIYKDNSIIHKLDKKFLPDDIGGGADWNASEGEPGHVLNRTHWVESGRVEVLAECQPAYDPSGPQFTAPAVNIPTAGGNCTVNWNGVEYVCVAQDGSALAPGLIVIGDGNQFGLQGNGEPFLIMAMEMDGEKALSILPTDGTTELTISVYAIAETVHKINDKFLPTTPIVNKGNKYGIAELTLDSDVWPEMELDESDNAELFRAMNSGILMVGVPMTFEGETGVYDCPVTFISSTFQSYGSCNLPDGTFLKVMASTSFGTVSLRRVSKLSL